MNRAILQRVWLPIGIVILALLAYANSFPGAFILDDNTIVVGNSLIARIDLWRIFVSDYWGLDANSGLYRPLTILSLAVNRALFGASPLGFHAVNVILHAAVALLLAAVLLRHSVPAAVAWLAAALFAVHPIHTEVLNQVVGRAELLAALFIFAALWAGAAERDSVVYIGVVACYSAALLSKEHGVVLLGLLPLVDLAFGRWRTGGWRRRVGLYLLLLAMTCLWLGWRQWGIEHRVPRDLIEAPFAPLYYFEPLTRMLTALKIQWFYLWKLLWPLDLQAVYAGERWFAPVNSVLTPVGFGLVAATLLLGAVVLWGCRRGHWAGWALVLYAVTFVPTSNLLVPIGVSMAERLAYLPSAWFCLTVAAGLSALPKRTATWGCAAVLIVGLTVATWIRNRDYASAITLWETAVTRDPVNPIAWLYLGEAYFDAGDPQRADAAFRRQTEIAPDFNRHTGGYTDFIYLAGNFDRAIEVGLRIEQRGESTPVNRMALARSYLAKDDFDKALRWLDACREHYQQYALYWKVRGEILRGLGRYEEAIAAWRQAMTLATYDDLPVNLVQLLVEQERAAEGEAVARELLARLSSADAWNALGVTLAVQGRLPEAVVAFGRAVALDPAEPQFRQNAERARRAPAPVK